MMTTPCEPSSDRSLPAVTSSDPGFRTADAFTVPSCADTTLDAALILDRLAEIPACDDEEVAR